MSQSQWDKEPGGTEDCLSWLLAVNMILSNADKQISINIKSLTYHHNQVVRICDMLSA